jgi:hypothetical protein
MNNYGFYLTRLSLEGTDQKTAEVIFTKGLNVIYGASDTGKTYIYQCIDYLLGSSSIPKNIPEARNYTSCTLEIKSYEGEMFNLKRNLNGGNIKLTRNNQKSNEVLIAANNQKNGETISDFLLKLCNIQNKEIRKNIRGETRKLYFQNLRKYFLVDEERIITQKSPIVTEQYTEQTFDENTFKFLLSGIDDANVTKALTKDEITNKRGKVELYNELIRSIQLELSEANYEEVNAQIEKLDNHISNFKNQYFLSSQEFHKYNEEKNKTYNHILSLEKRLVGVNEVLKRSNILRDQYQSDISRLKSTLEAGYAFDFQSISNCPVCNNKIEIQNKTDIDELVTSINKEISKINLLSIELNDSFKIFQSEKNEIVTDLDQHKEKYEAILCKIQNEINEKLNEISSKIKDISKEKEELSKIKTLKSKLDEYILSRNHIKSILGSDKELGKEVKYDKITSLLLKPILDDMLNTLIQIKFNAVENVLYSESSKDFVIGNKNRKDFGKGYRAILFSIYIIALLRLLEKNTYQIGFVVIDSPLNPYKPDEKTDNGTIPENLASNFYKYLAESITDSQVILIENTPVPEELTKNINIIQYTRGFGFIPK